ncbi:MAG: helix-turn-helix domain-containing protein [Bacteroidota bacterium]|nr:helix-turn-helix domain-containing protein [Bacteroidota bacterium]
MSEVLFNTNEVAKMLQVDKSTVKRWTEDKKLKCFRTPGGHRKFRAEDLYNFMTEFNYGVSTLQIIPQLSSDEAIIKRIVLKREYNVLHSVCFNAAIKGKKDDIITLFSEVVRAGLPLTSLFDHVLRPTLKKIHNTFRSHKISFIENQLALNALSSAIVQLSDVVTKISKNEKTVICALLGQGKNDIEFNALTTLLEIDGYTVLNLGEGVTSEIIDQLIAQVKPYAVCIYSTLSVPEHTLNTEAVKLAETSAQYKTLCFFGGEAILGNGFSEKFPTAKMYKSFSEFELIQHANAKMTSLVNK